MTGLLLVGGAVVLALVLLYSILDWIRERRELKQHLQRIEERKEAFQRFKEKKRRSTEGPSVPQRGARPKR
jgi:hypothetical protein